MPVHLFGRPADLEALARIGVPIIEDAAQAFGAQGIATTGVASTFSFFPTKNLFALGDGGLVAATDLELADRVRLLRFHGSSDKRRSSTSARTRGSTSCRPRRCGSSSASSTVGTRPVVTPPHVTRELGLGEFCDLPEDEPGHVYHMYVVRSPERARYAAGVVRGRNRACLLLRDARLICSRRFVPSASRRDAARDRARRAREPRAADVGRDHGGIQERVVSIVRARPHPRAARDPDQPPSHLAGARRRGPRSRSPGTSPSSSASTSGVARLLRHAFQAHGPRSSSGSSSLSSSSSASTTAGGATSPRATCGAQRAGSRVASLARRRHRLLRLAGRRLSRLPRADRRRSTGCSCSPSSPARVCSRARSSSGPRRRAGRARQGSARHRRRRRGRSS